MIWRNLRSIRRFKDVVRLVLGFHSIIFFFKPSILARRLTERFIAYQGSDRLENSNIEHNEIYEKVFNERSSVASHS